MDLDASIIKIHYSKTNNMAVGAGFLVTQEGWGLTCQHVIDSVEDKDEIWVSWENINLPIRAHYYPEWSDLSDRNDFAIIKVHIPEDGNIRLPPMLKLSTACKPGDLITGKGFQDSIFEKTPAQGIVLDKVKKRSNGCYYWALKDATYVDEGISGAPALNTVTNAVVGIFTEKHVKIDELPDIGLTYMDKLSLVTPLDEIAKELLNRDIRNNLLSEFIDTLLFPVSESGGFTPSLPRNYIETEKFNNFESSLLSEKEKFLGITGMAGVGKTTLAVALSNSMDVQKCYSGGIYWIECNKESEKYDTESLIISYQEQLWEQLRQELSLNVSSWQAGVKKLQRVLDKRLAHVKSLIILDDPPGNVIDQIIAAFNFKNKITFLITTQQREILRSRGIPNSCIFELQPLEDSEAQHLLSKWLYEKENANLPESATEVMHRCGNLPLALSMIGATVKGWEDIEIGLQDMLEALEEGEIDEISHQVDHYPIDSLSVVLSKSIALLDEKILERFVELAVFPIGWRFSISFLSRIWDQIKERHVRRFAQSLIDKSLFLQTKSDSFIIHSTLRSHLRQNIQNLGLLYQKIIPKYDKNSPLLLAVNWEDKEAVQSLLGLGGDVNKEIFENGTTALHLASEHGNLVIVRMLIEAGAHVDQTRASDGRSAIHVAAFYGRVEVLRFLVERGAIVDQQDSKGFSALQLASQGGFEETVSFLLANGAQVELKNAGQKTAIYVAAWHGQDKIVQLLLESKPLKYQETDPSETPLRAAAGHGHLKATHLLLNAGADVNWASPDDKGTALHLAAQNGAIDVVNLLIANGADINKKGSQGSNALHLSSQNGHIEIVRILLKAEMSVNEAGENGCAPLHLSSQNGHWAIVKELIEAKADINQKIEVGGYTSLYLAAQNGHEKVIQLLLDAGAEIECYSDEEITPFLVAAYNGRTKVLDVLINAGANVNQQGNRGTSALHVACQNWHLDAVHLLIGAGANVNIANNNGWTPLHVIASQNWAMMLLMGMGHRSSLMINEEGTVAEAKQWSGAAILFLLLTGGADINAQTNDGKTALDLADLAGNDLGVKMLQAPHKLLESVDFDTASISSSIHDSNE